MRARLLVAITAAFAAVLVTASPAAAKGPDPCKVLKKSEIASVFGATVSSPKKGLTTPISAQCHFDVSETTDRPEGEVTVHVMFTGAKAAFDGLDDFGYVPVTGLSKALYDEKTGTVDALKGSVLLGVQGVFLDSSSLPIEQVDVQDDLVQLAKKGLKRV